MTNILGPDINALPQDSYTFDRSYQSISHKVLSPFPSESALVNKFSNATRNRISLNTDVAYEIETSNGIADIVLFNKRKDWEKYSDLTSLGPHWVYPLIALPYRKKFSVSQFSKISCVSKNTATKYLRQCEMAGYCEKLIGGWRKIKQPRSPFNEIVAIEAKIRDWKKALFQATRYKDFANKSWVLLDMYYGKAALKNIEEFKKRNIGLLLINSHGELFEVIKPSSENPKSEYRYWFTIVSILQNY